MQTILQGSLRHFAVADLLAFVCAHITHGTLQLQRGEDRALILYENSRILWAGSNRESDATAAVLDALTWDSGSFALVDAATLPGTATPVVIELSELLAEAKRRAEEAGYPDGTLFRVIPDSPTQEVSLTPESFQLLFRIGQGRTFRELVADSRTPRPELIERLGHLQKLGLIAIVSGDREARITLVQKKDHSRSIATLTTDDGVMHPLLEDESTVGRTRDNLVVLPDGSVSSKHARVFRTSEGFTIEDLGSRNGTFVNGEHIIGNRLLGDGDVVRVGKVLLTFNIAAEMRPRESSDWG